MFDLLDARPTIVLAKRMNEEYLVLEEKQDEAFKKYEEKSSEWSDSVKTVKSKKLKNNFYIVVTSIVIIVLILALVLVLDLSTAVIPTHKYLSMNAINIAHNVLEKLLEIMVAPIVLGMFFFKIEKYYDYVKDRTDEVMKLRDETIDGNEKVNAISRKISQNLSDRQRNSEVSSKYEDLYSKAIRGSHEFDREKGVIKVDGVQYSDRNYQKKMDDERISAIKEVHAKEKEELMQIGLWQKYFCN